MKTIQPSARPTISPALAGALYRLSAEATAEDQAIACDLYASLSQRDIIATERYVRACLVSQELAAA